MEWHPIACTLPMLEGKELQDFADDIRINGLQQSVTIFEGMVLDGRNRMVACEMVGVEPTFRYFEGTKLEALSRVWSLNRWRRHLTSSQAAAAEVKRASLNDEYAAEVEAMKADAAGRIKAGKANPRERIPEGADAGRVTEQRAKAAGTNRKYLEAAEKIEAERPDLSEKVLQGEMTIPQAKREMTPKAEQSDLDITAESAEEIAELLKQVAGLAKSVSAVAKSKAGAFVNVTLVNRALKEVRHELQRAILAQPCRKCDSRGCMLCKETGYVTTGHYDKEPA